MVDNIGRKLTLILAMLVIAVGCLLVPTKPFRLGLDLQGGTRLAYRFDFEEAVADGTITQEEASFPDQLMQSFIGIIRSRVDPQGVLEPIIRAEGSDRVVIELPGAAEVAGAVAEVPLADEGLLPTAVALTLDTADEELLAAFPVSGGVISMGKEKIRYGERNGALLSKLQRGYQGTTASEHSKADPILLVSDDSIRNAIENTGEMHFFLGATSDDFTRNASDETSERQLVNQWILDNPGLPITAFNKLPRDQGGPAAGMRWFPMRTPSGEVPKPLADRRLEPLVLPPEEWQFKGDHLELARPEIDRMGFPAVYFQMKGSKKYAFGEFTREHVGDAMAIVLNDEIATLANIKNPLPGSGIIEGGAKGFTRAEVDGLVTVLRSGSLRIKPELESEERVGATLGDEYVRKGFISALVGLGLVLSFVMIYYRRLGVFAAISLLANLTLLMGTLAFLQATLTLPGIAGIILTVGMAVDANILIFERIREESARSKPLQAAKNGFEKALSTIVDANLTTLITAIILYKVGTGPVRGFATTLGIGILTSMFSALIITRVLVHLHVVKSSKPFSMARLVAETSIDFMKKSKLALTFSLILIIAGLTLFISLPDRDKLGIDFTGGFTLTVRTESPEATETIRERVRSISGTVGEAEVKPILDSQAAGGFTRFRITGKAEGVSEEAQEGDELTGSGEIRQQLGDLLEKGPFDIAADAADSTQISGRLYFEEDHAAQDVAVVLTDAGLIDPLVEAVPDRPGIFTFSGSTNTPRSISLWTSGLETSFKGRKDASKVLFRPVNPIPEQRIVGSQVVGELRDKAVLAILLSLFAAIMYIRARFAEYSYGFAAVIAIIHDVLITLGVLGVAIATGAIEAEISLPMIAAFLTIIGYSLNDTIVVFDRIRENLPRMKGSLKEVLNKSINQTLARTLLTSITTLLAVLVLLAFNLGSRNVLEGFAFALAVGVLVGTYSSIFVASPALLWFEARGKRKEKSGASEKRTPVKAGA